MHWRVPVQVLNSADWSYILCSRGKLGDHLQLLRQTRLKTRSKLGDRSRGKLGDMLVSSAFVNHVARPHLTPLGTLSK